MSDQGKSDETYKYWAFISHASEDARQWVIPLLRRVESFRVPKHLVKTEHNGFKIPARLRPLFRDRYELPAAPDLWQQLKDALEKSRYLIVVCSEHSKNSQYVREEIRWFKDLGRADRILLYHIEGEPQETILDEILSGAGADGATAHDHTAVPLAADARPNEDGKDAPLKIIAGMLGVGFDDLKQREQRRRQKKLIWTLAATSILLAIVSGLGVFAEYQRRKAETNFNVSTAMIKDTLFKVQDSLEVTPRTLRSRQDINAIIRDGVEQLRESDPSHPEVSALDAHVKMDMSMIIESYGVSDKEGIAPAQRYVELLEGAVSRFRQLASSYPENVQYQRDLSWACRKLARVYENSRDFESAGRLLDEALRAIEIASAKEPAFRKDLRWVLMNLGDLARRRYEATDPEQRKSMRSKLERALERYLQALKVPNASPTNETIDEKHTKCSILDRVCDIYLLLEEPAKSKKNADELIALREKIVKSTPDDKQARQHLSLAYFKMGNALVELDQLKEAVEEYQHTLSIRTELLVDDPGNLGVKRGVAESYGRIGTTQLAMENPAEALENLRKSNEIMEEVIEVEPQSFFDADLMFATDFRIAEALWNLDQFDQSIEQFRTARKRLIDFDKKMATSMFQEKIGWISGVIDEREKQRQGVK
jgi:tetratricopeptide (TPR) repeat protein